MRLHKHDELVEAIAEKMCTADEQNGGLPWGSVKQNKHSRGLYIDRAAATLDALLDAAVRLGVGSVHIGKEGYSVPHIILRMEASDDA